MSTMFSFSVSAFFEKLKCRVVNQRAVRVFGFLRFVLLTRFNGRVVFFFPFFHTGGAEKVHRDIVTALSDSRPIVLFTGTSRNDHFKADFTRSAECFDLSSLIGSRRLRGFIKWALIKKIDLSKRITVFGCNSKPFYDLIPRLSEQVRVCDLIHAFVHEGEIGAESWSLPLVDRISCRVVISPAVKSLIAEQYDKAGLAAGYVDRVRVIENKVRIPGRKPLKDYWAPELRVLYVGRASREKRVHLVGLLAELCSKRNPATFRLIGEGLREEVPEYQRQYCEFLGGVAQEEQLDQHYAWAHVLVLVSSREGFPMVIMEAMAQGCVTVTTNVGGISHQIVSGKNGYLVETRGDTNALVKQMAEFLSELSRDRAHLQRLGCESFKYAKSKFSGKTFDHKYRDLLWHAQNVT